MPEQTVVVTGAGGMVGTKVIQHLQGKGYRVHAVTRSAVADGHPAQCASVTLHTLDLAKLREREIQDWLDGIRPTALIHCAAMTNVDACESQPLQAHTINSEATRRLARACAYHQIHLVMVSTDYVFDGMLEATKLYNEMSDVHPLNYYGWSKWRGEVAVQKECNGKTLWTICRTSVVYGTTPWTRPDFTQWLFAKLDQGEMVRIVADQVSSPTYSGDLARMLVRIIELHLGGLYHTAGSTPINRYHFARLFASYLGLKESLIHPMSTCDLHQTAQRPLNAGLGIDKISEHLGIRPLTLSEGLMCSWKQAQAE